MSPDSAETRIRNLETGLARLEQQVVDLIAQMTKQFQGFEDDITKLAPGIADSLRLIADIRSDIRGLRKDLDVMRADVETNSAHVGEILWLKERVVAAEEYRKTREERERLEGIERRKERREDKKFAIQVAVSVAAVIITALGLLLAFF